MNERMNQRKAGKLKFQIFTVEKFYVLNLKLAKFVQSSREVKSTGVRNRYRI